MTSQIISETIDENFPVAGQDNDSQGFRDNFSVIKTGLATAQSEITVLQNTTAKVSDANNDPVSNDFLGSSIENAQTNKIYGISYQLSQAGEVTVDFEDGEYQYVNLTGSISNVTFKFTSWPSVTDTISKLTLEISHTISTGTVNIIFDNDPSATAIKYGWTGAFEMDSTSGTKIVEVLAKRGNTINDLTLFVSLKGEFA